MFSGGYLPTPVSLRRGIRFIQQSVRLRWQINWHSHSSPEKRLYLYKAVDNYGIGHLMRENFKKVDIPLYVAM